MTGPEDSQSATRPISVAELLAKNGTIGAPPVGGRRRRRRGNADSVTVAELTGEIPVVREDPAPETGIEPDPAATEPEPEPTPEVDEARASDAEDGVDAPPDTGLDTAEADYDAHVKARDTDSEPIEFRPGRRRRPYASALRDYQPTGTGAERMSPDPLDDLDEAVASDGSAQLVESVVAADEDADTADTAEAADGGGRASLTGSSSLGPLFGGESVADDLARRGEGTDADREDGGCDELDDLDELDDDELDDDELAEAGAHDGSPLVRGMWIVAQCIIAVAFGAGLFIAFDQLWKWNTIIALVLAVLVILGLAGGVRVVRKTEDIGSTLTAVAVGALVTFGPLVLLQAS